MKNSVAQRVGYVVKRYPRYSETFVVNEILAHEEAGLSLDIFSLYPASDTHFQESLARVRAPVTFLSAEGLKAVDFWGALRKATEVVPELWSALESAKDAEPREVYQAARLASEARTRGITHLHAHFASTATSVAQLAARFAGISYSFTAHAKDIFHESVAPAVLRDKLAGASAVFTVSDYNVSYLREKYGNAAAAVSRVYNGLDLGRFAYLSPHSRPREIIAVGRLVEKKGFADLISACAILAQRNGAFR